MKHTHKAKAVKHTQGKDSARYLDQVREAGLAGVRGGGERAGVGFGRDHAALEQSAGGLLHEAGERVERRGADRPVFTNHAFVGVEVVDVEQHEAEEERGHVQRQVPEERGGPVSGHRDAADKLLVLAVPGGLALLDDERDDGARDEREGDHDEVDRDQVLKARGGLGGAVGRRERRR